MTIDLRDEFRRKYGTPQPLFDGGELLDPLLEQVEAERAFVVHAESGRTVITAPLREIASQNAGFMYLRGRFVEADNPNRNGAMWTTEDLELGQGTVAGGPLNWLHQETDIIGAILSGGLVAAEDAREAARNFSADKRRKLAKSGKALPDESFPIENAKDLANAIKLAGNAKNPAKARAHIKKRARALGLYDRIPDSWKSEKSELDVGNHIVADAAVWRFLFPRAADTIERAAADGGLYFSMECISKEVACVDSPGRPGCGETFAYGDYDAGRCCSHLRERSSVRRFVEPVFLGGAVIVPPVQPGWAHAQADVVRQAAALAEQEDLASDLSKQQALNLAEAVLGWANRD